MSYNGWTNYETWLVNLWMDNEEGSYRGAQELARSALEDESDRDDAVQSVAEHLKEEHESAAADAVPAGVFSDLVGAALSEVDWREIAGHLVDAAEEEAAP